MSEIKIYFAGKFNLAKTTEKLSIRLKDDYRSYLLGSSEKLTFSTTEGILKNYPIHYSGCFYCEQASEGDYTSTDCEVVVREEVKAIMSADIFCCVFDFDFSVGTVVELMDAAIAKKQIVIFYKNEENSYTIKSEYWFAITRALEICKSNNTKIEIFEYKNNVLPILYNWLNNLIYTKKYVCIRKNKLDEYLKGYILKECYEVGNKKVSCYEFNSNRTIVELYPNSLIIVKTSNDIHNKGLVDVTDNELYNDESIKEENIVVTNAIIEGTDGVGKTATITNLIHQGIVCKDRSELICKYMLLDIPMEDRCRAYVKYLEHTTEIVVFLINNSEEELKSRINKRTTISEFDKMAYEYNTLYKETYSKMLEHHLNNPIELVDCTGLSLKEQVEKIKETVLRRIRR